MIYQKSWRNLECLVNRYVRLTLFILCCFQFVGCENRGFTEGEGYIDVTGGKVWYKIVGSGSATPLLSMAALVLQVAI